MIKITSQNNIHIKAVKRLKTKKGRDALGCYIIEGRKLVFEAANYNAEIVSIFCSEDYIQTIETESILFLGRSECVSDALDQSDVIKDTDVQPVDQSVLASGVSGQVKGVNNNDVRLFITGRNIFSLISDTETPQGVLAVIRKPNFKIVSGNWLILDRIQDPGNLGTIIRTAAATGFGTVIAIKGGSDIYAPKVVRASAGAFFRISATTLESADEAISLARKHGKTLIAADPREGVDCFRADLTKPFALVIGNEGGGLDSLFSKEADQCLSIPMQGDSESLNASIAASVIMFETVRQTASS